MTVSTNDVKSDVTSGDVSYETVLEQDADGSVSVLAFYAPAKLDTWRSQDSDVAHTSDSKPCDETKAKATTTKTTRTTADSHDEILQRNKRHSAPANVSAPVNVSDTHDDTVRHKRKRRQRRHSRSLNNCASFCTECRSRGVPRRYSSLCETHCRRQFGAAFHACLNLVFGGARLQNRHAQLRNATITK